MLRHPYSVDLYVESVISQARFVLVRLLGGLDYWRYGVQELAAAARRHKFDLAIVPGDERADPRLDEFSTLSVETLRAISRSFESGGALNFCKLFDWMERRVAGEEFRRRSRLKHPHAAFSLAPVAPVAVTRRLL